LQKKKKKKKKRSFVFVVVFEFSKQGRLGKFRSRIFFVAVVCAQCP